MNDKKGNKSDKNQTKRLRALYRRTAARFGRTYVPRRIRREWADAQE